MSLVDYASSSDENDDEGIAEEHLEEQNQQQQQQQKEKKSVEESTAPPPSVPPMGPHNQNFTSASSLLSHQPSSGISLPPPQLEKLPDASLLFASPSFLSSQSLTTDHSSRVAAAIAASESRKRESNGSVLAHRRSKEPKGPLPPTRNIPDTVGGKLIPPQLRGRSNVVTEDISKLFVARDGQNPSRSN